MSVGFNFKVAPVVTNPGDVTPEFVVFGASSQSAESPVLIRVNAFDGSTNLSVTGQSATSLTISSDTGTDAVIPAATTSLAGLMTAADKVALAAAGTGVTNLSIANHGASTLDIASSTGTDATIPAATTSLAGLMSAADKTALDDIDSGTAIAAATEGAPGVGDFIPYLTAANAPGKVEGDYYAVAASMPELIRDTMGTALVQGANITITVNDAGDTITIAASGGSGRLSTINGKYFGEFASFSQGALTANRIYYIPLIVPNSTTVDQLSIWVATSDAAALLKMGIYSPHSTTRLPNSKVVENTADLSGASTGRKDAVFGSNPTLAAGLHWLALASNSSTVQVRIAAANFLPPFCFQNSIDIGIDAAEMNTISIVETFTYASGSAFLPATATPTVALFGQNPVALARAL
jgi:hypothetical protein